MRATVMQDVDLAVLGGVSPVLRAGRVGFLRVAELLQLAFVGDVKPQPAEYPLLLQREHFRVGIGAAMNVIGLNQRFVSRFGSAADRARRSSAFSIVPWSELRRAQFTSPPKISRAMPAMPQSCSRRFGQGRLSLAHFNVGSQFAEQRGGVHCKFREAKAEFCNRTQRQNMPGMRSATASRPAPFGQIVKNAAILDDPCSSAKYRTATYRGRAADRHSAANCAHRRPRTGSRRPRAADSIVRKHPVAF